ncbi:type IVB secretion system protein IcmF [Legionella quinlivanii]|uniref:type IVB secretion system protein IcmF n=1 Tax=Legionella quinlivanii TaxID=45073 RepID=UPI002242F4A9|nr:type IVB secretion system protein IcmF [Legionella quinlivanii]MCW8451266.1 type IVB secretion system protein IcmF [Legionella quinlivanii]
MDRSLQALCDALKKIINLLKPQSTPLSFLLVIGKSHQGKTTLLKQAQLNHHPVDELNGANFFYNNNGIILELGETWLHETDNLLHHNLKQLNRCHRGLRISGILLCVDSRDLLMAEPVQIANQCKSHAHLLERFSKALGYQTELAVIFTKLDTLAGFCEFFQSEHVQDLNKPLGFSLDHSMQSKKLIEQYRLQFDRMIEVLSQETINKLHPARSSVKRTLIREFPLQLASLRIPVQTLIQQLIAKEFRVQAVYFTSAEQGGLSVDRLNQRIQHEYALTIPDKYPQSTNYRAYFIEGPIKAFQDQTKKLNPSLTRSHKIAALGTTALVTVFLTGLWYQYSQTSQLLDDASKELLAYETLSSQNKDLATALYHLSQAETKLNLIPPSFVSHPVLEQLKVQLHGSTLNKLHNNFLPDVLAALEDVISNPSETQLARYQALKIYLMLGEPEHFSEAEVTDWFSNYWKATNAAFYNDKQLLLLHNALKQPRQALAINQQIVSDARNYLNALPAAYLYYSLAKAQFPQGKTSINVEGFDLAAKEVPDYFTKTGFGEVSNLLPQITATLQKENWVLARQDLDNLQAQLEQAYCFDYSNWWLNFTRRTRPQHYQGYQQARQLTQTLEQSDSIRRLVQLIQQQTSPEAAENSSLFNQKIASQFTGLNLMTSSAAQELTINISELEKFLTTLSLVNDQGQTVFDLTQARFRGDTMTDPLSSLYNRSRQLPEPIASWAKQIADDTWFIFINESRDFLNKQWNKRVYSVYKNSIAKRYPLDPAEKEEIGLEDFDHFFSPHGTLNSFVTHYLKPFLDTSHAQWQPKELNGYMMPVSTDLINELIRANVISNMFFPDDSETSRIDFSLQKINLDPVVSNFQLTIGETSLSDNQNSESDTEFTWPQRGAKLSLSSIEGNHYELEESGTWAFFKMLQKVNVLVDSNDSSSLQILFEVNGNSGRYLLKTQNQINPFSPGILTGFSLKKDIAKG